MQRTLLILALLAPACVPSEDGSGTKEAGAQPAPAEPAEPAPPGADPKTRRMSSPRRLDPNRPMRAPPERNPFALSDAAAAAVADAAAQPAMEGRPHADGDARMALGADAAPAKPAAMADAAAAKAGAEAAAPTAAPDSLIAASYYDNFDRAELGPEWNPTSPEWRIQAGQLCGRGARNHPVWLKRKLPVNARIEFDAVSSSPDGDLKVEVWGDGKSFAKGTSYNDATSYLAILGGWKNQFHVLARLDEHLPNRPEVKVNPSGADFHARPVKPGQRYHFKVERADGKTVRWLVDDIEIISFADPSPLKGEGHEHLGFNDWDAPVCFDNLHVEPLPGG